MFRFHCPLLQPRLLHRSQVRQGMQRQFAMSVLLREPTDQTPVIWLPSAPSISVHQLAATWDCVGLMGIRRIGRVGCRRMLLDELSIGELVAECAPVRGEEDSM